MNPLQAPPIEHRAFGTVDLRAAASSQRRIVGYGAVFNRFSRNLGGFVEQVAPTAFNDSRGRDWPDVVARYNHDSSFLLGTSHRDDRPAPTLLLSIDQVGLRYDIDPPRSRADIVELIARGDVRRSSFAFTVHEDEWTLTPQGFPLRTLISVRLVDVSPVSEPPAYEDTSAALRSLALVADHDVREVRALAAENGLAALWDKTARPKPVPHTPARLLGARARQKIEALASAERGHG